MGRLHKDSGLLELIILDITEKVQGNMKKF